MTCSKRNTLIERLPRPIVLLLWFFGVGTLYTYIDIRRGLLNCWLGTFAKQRPEVPILTPDDLPEPAKEAVLSGKRG